jgi:hypothetical protein
MAAEMPCTVARKNGSEKTRLSDSETTRAIVSVRLVTSVRAARLGTYPRLAIASSTARRVSGRTFGERFTTLETVAVDTAARRATSASVGAGRREGAPSPGAFTCLTSLATGVL